MLSLEVKKKLLDLILNGLLRNTDSLAGIEINKFPSLQKTIKTELEVKLWSLVQLIPCLRS